jgi:xylan 1,4-beta-xylosidase
MALRVGARLSLVHCFFAGGRNMETRRKFRVTVLGAISTLCILSFAVIAPPARTGDEPVQIQVRADHPGAELRPIWNYFGYDEPNYTYAPNGRKLLDELQALSAEPIYVRAHNLFTTGDGSASLKWGSTNVYTEDASGKPIYDFKIVDRIFDTYHELGIRPDVELGFMPQALSTHPEPYRHTFPNTSVQDIYTGWAYPPTNYDKWGDLVFHFVQHLRQRYGDDEVRTWLWEVWNEPDIGYWKGTREEYFRLYDVSVEAVLRALPDARVGGPETTGPLGDSSGAQFLRAFLQHCAHEKNYATGKTGSRLDFISFHPKGSPALVDGHVRMGISHQLAVVETGFQIVKSFPEFQSTPIILGESDPEGCAACSAKEHPANAYRNGPLFASYTAAIMNQISALARKDNANLRGAVTWSFEFEDQPWFLGYRELATNGVDKPVLNAFRMFGLLRGARLDVTSSGAVPLSDFLASGVRARADVQAVAARRDREISVMMWNYHDDDLPAPDASVNLVVSGVPADAKRVLVEQFRVDDEHSNSYAVWQHLGSPQQPTPEQYRMIEAAGRLDQSASPEWKDTTNSDLKMNLALPRQGLCLVRISW